MARTRNIKPAFFLDEELAELSAHARLLYIGLWCIADRNGVLQDRPKWIKAQVFPHENIDVNELLTVISPWINRYSVGDCSYIKIVNFLEHQNPHHTEKESGFPINGDLTVKQPLSDGENPALNLIPYTLNLKPIDDYKSPHPEYDYLPTAFKKAGKGWRITKDWELCEEWGRWAVDKAGLHPDKVILEESKFKDYFLSKNAKKPVKKDWFQTWRNWIEK